MADKMMRVNHYFKLLGSSITSIRTLLSECKVWKCNSLQDKQSKGESNKNQTRPKRRKIQQKTICIVCSFFWILAKSWSVCKILSIQISIKYVRNPLPILERGECVEISSKPAQTASRSRGCL